MSKDALTIKQELAKPFAPEDLEWRLQQTIADKCRGLAVPYVTNRAIQDRLDDVVGPENWHNEFKPWHGNGKKESQICGISIFFEGRGFVTKWDGAEDTDIEAIKGGLSDSMKRAAVQWGIGRVLYKMEPVWVTVEQRGKSWIIKDSERSRLDMAYLETLKKLKLTPAQPGGLQSELTPKPEQPRDAGQNTQGEKSRNSGKKPAQTPQPVPAPAPKAPPAQSSDKITQLPTARAPKCEYTVISAKEQSGMNQNPVTSLTLRGQDGKTVPALFRGIDKALTSGAELTNVKLTMKKQNTVIFYVLEGYEVMNAKSRAA